MQYMWGGGSLIMFIQSYLIGDIVSLRTKLAIVILMWLIVTIAMLIDLRSGVKKAKERGEISTSYGYRETVKKANLYYSLMAFAFLVDCIGTFFYPLPIVTFIASFSLVLIEAKSVLEKAHEKDKRKIISTAKDVINILKDKDFIGAVNQISEVVDNREEKALQKKISNYNKDNSETQ